LTKTVFRLVVAAALAASAALAGCGGVMAGSDDDALYELAGAWYDSRCFFAFEITQDGDGYIAASKTQCAVSVSGGSVYFKDGRGREVGSFSYTIKTGQLTMTTGTGDFRNMPSSSPFVKSGTIPSGGAVPVELIGRWYAKSNSPAAPNFEIAASGAMTISGSMASYTAIVTGNNKVSVLEGSVLQGEFQYYFMYGEIIVTNGTDICKGLAVLSPFVKKT
jgi:hypothetical protein